MKTEANPSEPQRQSGASHHQFESLSAVLPLLNESSSFRSTVSTLVRDNGDCLKEILVVICERTLPQSIRAYEESSEEHPGMLRLLRQSRPRLGGAFQEGITQACGSHILLMFCDLESDPAGVAGMVSVARSHPCSVVSASRWLVGGVFEGYSPCKLVANYFFQMFFRSLYFARVTDFTFGFRLYPASVLRRFRWRQVDHSFVFESILAPIRAGIPILEVPAVWRARTENAGQSTFSTYLSYVPVGFRMRCQKL